MDQRRGRRGLKIISVWLVPAVGSMAPAHLGREANIKHRIEYSTAFSLLPFDQISDEIMFNAVNETDQKTGQAFGSRHVVMPATLFPSIVTLKAVSRESAALRGGKAEHFLVWSLAIGSPCLI